WQQNAAAFRSLIERNVRLKIVITGHNKRVYSYPRQLFEAFPDIAGLEDIASIEHRPHADHTFGAEAERRILESSLIDWLAAAVPADPAVARPAPSRSTPHYRMKSST